MSLFILISLKVLRVGKYTFMPLGAIWGPNA